MDILLICFEYPPIGGGGGVGAQLYAESWAAKGHRVTVLTSRSMDLPAKETVNGVKVIRVHAIGRRNRATSTVLSMLSYIIVGIVYLFIHRRAFQHVQVLSTHFSIPSGPVGYLASKLLRSPNVLTIVGGDIYDPTKRSSPHLNGLLRMINRWVINGADRVVAISSDTKRRSEKYYGISRKIEVINYGFKSGIDQDVVAVKNPRPKKFYLIAVGRLVSRKGFHYLIAAMAHLPDEIELRLVGDGPLESTLRRTAKNFGVEHRVHLLGYQCRAHIRQHLHNADCFVLPSLHEGLGIVVQEAMFAGLPVVATDNGGQVDLINDQRNGLLVGVRDEVAMAKAIHRVYNNPDLAASMGKNNLADIRAMDIDKNCEHYIELFYDLVLPGSVNPESA